MALDIEALAQIGMGLSIFAVGLVRLLKPEEESQNPTAYGWMTHGMAALSLFLTVIFLGKLYILWR